MLDKILDLGKSKPPAQPLLSREINYGRSVIHASIQASARAINEAMGVTNEALLDEFMATDAGKKWVEGFRQYAIYVLGKTL